MFKKYFHSVSDSAFCVTQSVPGKSHNPETVTKNGGSRQIHNRSTEESATCSSFVCEHFLLNFMAPMTSWEESGETDQVDMITLEDGHLEIHIWMVGGLLETCHAASNQNGLSSHLGVELWGDTRDPDTQPRWKSTQPSGCKDLSTSAYLQRRSEVQFGTPPSSWKFTNRDLDHF